MANIAGLATWFYGGSRGAFRMTAEVARVESQAEFAWPNVCVSVRRHSDCLRCSVCASAARGQSLRASVRLCVCVLSLLHRLVRRSYILNWPASRLAHSFARYCRLRQRLQRRPRRHCTILYLITSIYIYIYISIYIQHHYYHHPHKHKHPLSGQQTQIIRPDQPE